MASTHKPGWASLQTLHLSFARQPCAAAQAWERFAGALPATAVGYLYVSEAHLEGSELKIRMRDAIRQNRRYGC